MTPRRLQALVLDLAMVTAAFTPSGKQLTMRCTSGLPDGATFYAAYAREADVVLLYEHPTFAEVRWKDEVPMVRPLGEFRAEDSRV